MGEQLVGMVQGDKIPIGQALGVLGGAALIILLANLGGKKDFISYMDRIRKAEGVDKFRKEYNENPGVQDGASRAMRRMIRDEDPAAMSEFLSDHHVPQGSADSIARGMLKHHLNKRRALEEQERRRGRGRR